VSDSNFKSSIESIGKHYHSNDVLDDKLYDHLFHMMLAKKLNLFSSARSILELGYGEGTVSKELMFEGFSNRTILEGSPDLCDRARKDLGESAIVLNTFFENFNALESFDLVLATNILEHVLNPIVILEKIRSWLTPAGTCVITVPNSESLHRRIALDMGLISSTKELSNRDKIVGHLRVYDLGELASDITKAGLKILKVEGMVLKFTNYELQKNLPIDVVNSLHNISSKVPAELCANLYVEVGV